MLERGARWLLAAWLCVLAWPAGAADLWDQLGPALIGASRAQIAAQLPIACQAVDAGQMCTLNPGTGTSFAGLPVRAVALRFSQDTLARVAVTVGDQHYPALLSLLTQRLGASDDRSFVARGGMAAEFEVGVHLWQQAGVSMVLEQFAGKIDRSVLTYGSTDAMADLVRSRTSYPRGARRDL